MVFSHILTTIAIAMNNMIMIDIDDEHDRRRYAERR